MGEKLTWWGAITMTLSAAFLSVGVGMYIMSLILAASGACDAAMFSAEWSIYLTLGGLLFAGSDAAAGVVFVFPIAVVVLGIPFAGAMWSGGCV